jgi:hypothetical protein
MKYAIVAVQLTSLTVCKRHFKFELGWLQRDGFHEMVKTVWKRPVGGSTPILRWNNNMCAMRRHLSGWAAHMAEILKKEKARLSNVIDELEAVAEVRPLSPHEIELKN